VRDKGGGNAGPWTRRETKTRFPTAPTALGNRNPRFPHSHRPDDEESAKTKKNGAPAAVRFAPAFRLILQ
jgi:hypothetical protein